MHEVREKYVAWLNKEKTDKEKQKFRMAPCFSPSFQGKSLSMRGIPPANPTASTENERNKNLIHKIH